MTTFDKIKHYLKSLTRDEKKEVRRRLKDDTWGEKIVTQNITLYPSFIRGHINGTFLTNFVFENDSNGDNLLLVYPMIEFADNNNRILKNINLWSDLFDEISRICDMAIWGTDYCTDSDMADGETIPLIFDDRHIGIYIFDDYEKINDESTLEFINNAVDCFIAIYLDSYYLVSGGHTNYDFPMTLTYETTIS